MFAVKLMHCPRGPAAIRFISRDACSESTSDRIVKLFRACFYIGYCTILARYVAKWAIAQMCLCETKYKEGGIAPFWGSANLPKNVSRDVGCRSDSITIFTPYEATKRILEIY